MNSRSRSQLAGVDTLALAFALPHEHKPQRLPVVPACLTSVIDLMSDTTYNVPDGAAGGRKSGFLCRDAVKPLWLTYSVLNTSWMVRVQGSATTYTIPNKANAEMVVPDFTQLDSSSGTLDGVVLSARDMMDYGALGQSGLSPLAVYIPPGSILHFEVITNAVGGGSGLEVVFNFHERGEVFSCVVYATSTSSGFLFQGVSNTTTVINGSATGRIPCGFTWITAIRTTQTAPTANSTPTFRWGWAVGATPTTLMLPAFPPAEFYNSTIPYQRTRLNSSAALFTNVSAVMKKEGTVLAGRLKSTFVEPWMFTEADINSIHPSLRYYGPLEKGLYTFTTPSSNIEVLGDRVVTIQSVALPSITQQPIVDFTDMGVYNAFIFRDVGSDSGGTVLAASLYVHLEFEAVSSLFVPGVSTRTLESLHAAEVAMLKFGHFHENPLHWAALKAAVTGAMRLVAPMVMPYVADLGHKAVARGVQYLQNKITGDRKMTQELTPKPQQRKKISKQQKKLRVKRGKQK